MPNPPKPTKLKLLEGNRGRRPINDREPQPSTDLVRCPAWVDGAGRRVWRQLEPEMRRMGLLTNFDVQHFGGYCQAVADIVRLRKFLRANGETYESGAFTMARHEVKHLENAYLRLRMFGAEFGMSPSSRTRLTLPGKVEQSWDEFLS